MFQGGKGEESDPFLTPLDFSSFVPTGICRRCFPFTRSIARILLLAEERLFNDYLFHFLICSSSKTKISYSPLPQPIWDTSARWPASTTWGSAPATTASTRKNFPPPTLCTGCPCVISALRPVWRTRPSTQRSLSASWPAVRGHSTISGSWRDLTSSEYSGRSKG